MNKFKKPLPIVLQAIVIYVSSLILSLIFSGLIGKLYRYVVGSYIGDTMFIIGGEGFNNFLGGSIWGYLFFIGLFIGIFIGRKFWLIWLVGFVLLGWLSLWSLKIFIISIGISILGFLLGKLILLVYKKIKK
ncbi:MAG TPA: hypothetical protein PLH37_03245 [bacterium]|nr:hypothetical protein [bacterium]